MRLTLLTAALAALATLATASQQGLSPSKDNTLYEEVIGALSNGAGGNFFAGRVGQAGGGGTIRRGVIAFDTTVIPAGSTVTAVTLFLNCSQTSSGNQTITLRRLTSDWGEGNSVALPGGGSGTASAPGDATWKHTFYPGSLWSTVGGDFVSTISGSTVVGATGGYTFASTANMVADVQSWLDNPSQNFGWCVRGNEASTSTAKRFDSRENSVLANRPVLTVTFTPPYTTYCTAKTNSLGCVPIANALGLPSATASSGFTVFASNMRNNKSGLLFYGVNGRAAIAFQAGTLCVKAPIKRTPGLSSGGSSTGNDCSGVYVIDMNAFGRGLSGGTPLPALSVPGTVVDCQWWGRDPGFAAPDNTTLSDGVEYTVQA
jgi:hypothetical protein